MFGLEDMKLAKQNLLNTGQAASMMPLWAVSAHLLATYMIEEDEALKVACKVLNGHLNDRASLVSLTALLKEAQEAWENSTDEDWRATDA